jgi:cysteinyl-tRNA synthetase
MTLHVRNTLTRRLEPFEPLEGNVVKMYVCGPTVYDSAHIGHAMSAIVFDVIRRYLEHSGYRVIHVMDFTDVDDKIIDRANELGQDPLDLAQRYIEAWFEHVLTLNLLPAHHYPRVSRAMPQVIEIVQALIDKKYAYTVNGDVYFRVRAFDDYGKPLGYDEEVAADAERALRRLHGALRLPMGTRDEGEAVENLSAQVAAAWEDFHSAMDDDFNTARALGEIFTLARAINAARDAGVGGEPFAEAQASLRRLTEVLGLKLRAEAGRGREVAPFIEALIEVRAILRREKQWTLADTIRDHLSDLGVALEDGPNETEWR